jgi:hypothetical protein
VSSGKLGVVGWLAVGFVNPVDGVVGKIGEQGKWDCLAVVVVLVRVVVVESVEVDVVPIGFHFDAVLFPTHHVPRDED